MQSGIGWRRPATVAVAFVLLAGATTAAALAQGGGAFASFGGSWSGSGQVRLEGGSARPSAAAQTRAEKRRNGAWALAPLRQRLGPCRAARHLTASGSRVSGSWEERSYGLGGQVSGTASGNGLRLTFSGGLSGSMTVTTTGGSQSISVRTDISALQGVSVNLRRSNEVTGALDEAAWATARICLPRLRVLQPGHHLHAVRMYTARCHRLRVRPGVVPACDVDRWDLHSRGHPRLRERLALSSGQVASAATSALMGTARRLDLHRTMLGSRLLADANRNFVVR